MNMKYIPPMIAAILIIIGIVFFYNQPGVMGNMIVLALLIGTVPFITISYLELQWIKAIEDQLPTLLLDLAETQKTGIQLPEALKLVSKTDYGRLTSEIKKINDQISWGIPVREVLDRFSFRLRKSDMVRRVVRIINESYSSGGDIARTMEATASDIATIKDAEKERKAMMFQHVIVMYAIYFIFIGIIVGLSKTLIPMLQMNVNTAVLGGILAFQDPCIACQTAPQLFCVSCSTFYTMCSMFALGGGASCYYRALFLLMAIVQGIFTGLVAGQIGEGSVVAGFKHSLIMTATGFAALMILLQAGLV